MNDFDPESRACDVRHSTIYPRYFFQKCEFNGKLSSMCYTNNIYLFRKAKDTSGSFRFILNTPDYVQSLEIERCIGNIT